MNSRRRIPWLTLGSFAVLFAAASSPAADVACGPGARVAIGDGRVGRVLAVGTDAAHRGSWRVATAAAPRGEWLDGRALALRPVDRPDDRCVAPDEPDDAVSFGPSTRDDDDPPRERN